MPILGPASATVPGAVAGWADAHRRWGRLPWKSLVAPAEALARDGFAVSLKLARAIRQHLQVVTADPGLRALFIGSDGAPLRPGALCRLPALAGTLSALASGGAAAFYGDEVGRVLSDAVARAGGALSPRDLADHRSEWAVPYRLPLAVPGLGPVAVHEQPLPSQGILVLVMLSLLDEAERRARATRPWEELHRQVEAKKVAFALKELFLTDPRAYPFPGEELAAELLSPACRDALAPLLLAEPLPFGMERATVRSLLPPALRARLSTLGDEEDTPRPGGQGTDTTYLCAVDAEGNAVGMIQSIFHPWGCGFLEPKTGILLNNRAVGFSLDPRHVNRLEPGKRTLHTLNSFQIDRGDALWLVSGTPGGDNQVQTNLQVVRHLLRGSSTWPGPRPMDVNHWSQARRLEARDERLPEAECLAMALEAPRWRHDHEASDATVRIEARMSAEIRKRLEKRGHRVERIGPWEGSGYVQAILRSEFEGTWIGATDPRGEGAALGL
ncbi:MAG: gamma-glutamyltransferase [Candidatus Eisenbacteria bacterium]